MNENHIETIMDIVDNFDYERVHKVMVSLDWQWSTEEGNRVPHINQLRKTSRKMLTETAQKTLTSDSKEFIIGTGGFRCEGKLYDDGFLYLRMAFEVTDYDNAE